MKALLLTGLILAASLTSFSQNEKHANWFKALDPIENDIYKCVMVNSVSAMTYCKFGYQMTNLTNDYLIMRLEESTFKLDGAEYHSKEKEVFVGPNKGKKGTFNATGIAGVNYRVDKFDFVFDGLYRLPAEGTTNAAPDFKLPASVKEIKFGDFKVKLKKLKKETKVTEAVFIVTYLGGDYAIVDPGKISVSIPDKGEDVFVNNAKTKTDILIKGETVTIKAIFNISAKYADMQFANMIISWNDAFQTSVAQKIEGATLSFELDEGLTEGKK